MGHELPPTELHEWLLKRIEITILETEYDQRRMIQKLISKQRLRFIEILPITMKTSFLTIADEFPVSTI